ncbi:hypothetical protein V1503_24430 [Bacillus sp. SCS-151]|uniref:hypothetical protein n=1 Tax=Nanhaiella sioensis TaxID=3115293 RepID=UPI00397A1BB3
MNEIIVGTGNEELDELIRGDLEQNNIGKVVSTVTTRKSLVNRVFELMPSIVFIGDDLVGLEENSDDEWILVIEELRKISSSLRVIFFCDRPIDDVFLTKLTTLNILDIFHEGNLPPAYIEQLQAAPAYKNIEQFRGKVDTVTEDMQKERERQLEQQRKEKEAESIIHEGKKPREGRVIETLVPIYEQLVIQPHLIVVASAFEGAGSSIIGRILAEYLSSLNLHVGVLESPFAKPYWFDALDASKHIKGEWKSWHRQLEENEQVQKGSDLEIHNVTYLIRNQRETYKKWDMMKTAHLVGYARQIPILIYDMSHGVHNEEEKLILRQANNIILTTKFDPVRVNREHESYKKMVEYMSAEQLGEKMIVIANESTPYLKKKYEKMLLGCYGVEKMVHFPTIQNINEWLMDGKGIWNSLNEKENESIQDIMSDLGQLILSKETYQKLARPKQKQGLFARFMKNKQSKIDSKNEGVVDEGKGGLYKK